MFRLLQALCIVLLLSACATTTRSGPLDAQSFTDAYVTRLHELAPEYEVQRQGQMALSLKNAQGAELSVYLNNAFVDYRSDTSRLQEVLDGYIAGVTEVISAELDTELRIEQVLPVIKGGSYVSEVSETLQQDGTKSADSSLYFEPINSELVVLYVQDNERSVRFLSKASIATLGLPAKELRERAITNFRKRLSGVQSQQSDDVYLLQLDGFYEASLLLVDELWQSPAFKVDGEIVAAVPARDVLMVSGSASANLGELRAMTADIVQQTGYSVSTQLFVRREGKWQVLE